MLELVALVEGSAPDWQEAAAYIDSLVLEEVGDDLLLECGVDTEGSPRETWLAVVQDRLRSDLASFRSEVDGGHEELELWELGGTRIFVSTGTTDDEREPSSGHGCLCRLVDSGVLAAAGFERLRKADLFRTS